MNNGLLIGGPVLYSEKGSKTAFVTVLTIDSLWYSWYDPCLLTNQYKCDMALKHKTVYLKL